MGGGGSIIAGDKRSAELLRRGDGLGVTIEDEK